MLIFFLISTRNVATSHHFFKLHMRLHTNMHKTYKEMCVYLFFIKHHHLPYYITPMYIIVWTRDTSQSQVEYFTKQWKADEKMVSLGMWSHINTALNTISVILQKNLMWLFHQDKVWSSNYWQNIAQNLQTTNQISVIELCHNLFNCRLFSCVHRIHTVVVKMLKLVLFSSIFNEHEHELNNVL